MYNNEVESATFTMDFVLYLGIMAQHTIKLGLMTMVKLKWKDPTKPTSKTTLLYCLRRN